MSISIEVGQHWVLVKPRKRERFGAAVAVSVLAAPEYAGRVALVLLGFRIQQIQVPVMVEVGNAARAQFTSPLEDSATS